MKEGVPEGILAITEFLATIERDETVPESPAARDLTHLSTREIEVLRLIAGGRSNQQIADELVISRNTVRRHVSNILDKAGVANRTQAVIFARDHGLA